MAKPSKLSFLDQGQEFVIFSNGCLDLSANLLIGNMGSYIECSIAFGRISSQKPAFCFLTLQSSP